MCVCVCVCARANCDYQVGARPRKQSHQMTQQISYFLNKNIKSLH